MTSDGSGNDGRNPPSESPGTRNAGERNGKMEKVGQGEAMDATESGVEQAFMAEFDHGKKPPIDIKVAVSARAGELFFNFTGKVNKGVLLTWWPQGREDICFDNMAVYGVTDAGFMLVFESRHRAALAQLVDHLATRGITFQPALMREVKEPADGAVTAIEPETETRAPLRVGGSAEGESITVHGDRGSAPRTIRPFGDSHRPAALPVMPDSERSKMASLPLMGPLSQPPPLPPPTPPSGIKAEERPAPVAPSVRVSEPIGEEENTPGEYDTRGDEKSKEKSAARSTRADSNAGRESAPKEENMDEKKNEGKDTGAQDAGAGDDKSSKINSGGFSGFRVLKPENVTKVTYWIEKYAWILAVLVGILVLWKFGEVLAAILVIAAGIWLQVKTNPARQAEKVAELSTPEARSKAKGQFETLRNLRFGLSALVMFGLLVVGVAFAILGATQSPQGRKITSKVIGYTGIKVYTTEMYLAPVAVAMPTPAADPAPETHAAPAPAVPPPVPTSAPVAAPVELTKEQKLAVCDDIPDTTARVKCKQAVEMKK